MTERQDSKPKTELLGIIGDNIRSLRCQHDMKSVELARAMGCHAVTITRYETGRINITINALERFAIFFAVP
ncbi:MAG: helix-turn-helix transcriptional regulator [Clostridia bacterium]|nr:helix-turn-helix transcriptional regulator [Clostridia bacterium]